MEAAAGKAITDDDIGFFHDFTCDTGIFAADKWALILRKFKGLGKFLGGVQCGVCSDEEVVYPFEI